MERQGPGGEGRLIYHSACCTPIYHRHIKNPYQSAMLGVLPKLTHTPQAQRGRGQDRRITATFSIQSYSEGKHACGFTHDYKQNVYTFGCAHKQKKTLFTRSLR